MYVRVSVSEINVKQFNQLVKIFGRMLQGIH